MDDSIDSGKFSVRGCLPLIQNDSTTLIHGVAVYVIEALPFAWDVAAKNFADSFLFFRFVFTQCFTSSPSLDFMRGF